MADSAVLVETTILVDYLRGSRAAADFLDGTSVFLRVCGRMAISCLRRRRHLHCNELRRR